MIPLDGKAWAWALDDFTDWLGRIEAQLDADAWDEPPVALALPVLTGTPDQPDVVLARQLQQRLAVCEQRIRSMLDDTAGELQALKQRRHAARNYAERGQSGSG